MSLVKCLTPPRSSVGDEDDHEGLSWCCVVGRRNVQKVECPTWTECDCVSLYDPPSVIYVHKYVRATRRSDRGFLQGASSFNAAINTQKDFTVAPLSRALFIFRHPDLLLTQQLGL